MEGAVHSGGKMRKVILVDPDQCGACHICEMVCSLFKEGECNPAISRIQILRGEMLETPLICQQCEVLFCASVCPTGAIKRDEDTGRVVVDEKTCNGCRACIAACPFQAIGYHSVRKKPLICDHCNGNPQCVEWCPREALQYLEITSLHEKEKIKGSEKIFSVLSKINK